jgi:hypothetical protein
MRARHPEAAGPQALQVDEDLLQDQALHPSWWQRLQLLWRLHLGLPAALGLVILVVSLPLVADRLVQYRRLQQAWATARPPAELAMPLPPERSGSASLATSPAGPPAGVGVPTAAAAASSTVGTPSATGPATTGATAPAAQASTLQATEARPAIAHALPTNTPPPPATTAYPRPPAAEPAPPSLGARQLARLIEALPPGSQRGADLGQLLAAVRTAGLSVQQADYALESSRIAGLARLKVDLQLQGTPAQLQQLLRLMQDRFTNLAIDVVELPAAGVRASGSAAAAAPASVLLHTVQFYRAVDG